MKISLAHLYLDFSLPRRLLGLCHAGKELVTKPLAIRWGGGGGGGGRGIQPIFGYRLACVTGGFLVGFLQTADCCF